MSKATLSTALVVVVVAILAAVTLLDLPNWFLLLLPVAFVVFGLLWPRTRADRVETSGDQRL